MSYLSGPRRSGARIWTIVVPADVQSVATLLDPIETVSAFVDARFAPEVNAVAPGNAAVRKAAASRRSIWVVTRTSSVIATAPAAVQAHAASLASRSPQSYAIYGTSGGDVWLVGNTVEGIRHACYAYLHHVGVRFLLPHPAWRVDSGRGSLEIDVSEVKSPALSSMTFGGNGGHGCASVHRETLESSEAWELWVKQRRNPAEIVGGFGDGDEAFTLDRQHELNGDHNMLAWVAAEGKRGYSSSSGDWPASCFATNTTLAKLCMTHHGPAGGTYPAAPAGPDVWSAPAAASWVENCVDLPPGGPITPDPGPDTGVNPSDDYTSFDGLVSLYCLHHRDAVCKRFVTYGAGHPFCASVSAEPNDGNDWCECDRCTDLLRNGPYAAYLTPAQELLDATASDKCWHLANELAKYMAHHFTNAAAYRPLVGQLAYTQHTKPPNIPIHQNSIAVVLAAGGENYGATYDETVAEWTAKRASNGYGSFKLGITPQYYTSNTTFDGPTWPSPKTFAEYVKQWIADGYSLSNAQTGYSSMCAGLAFGLLGELAWDASFDVDSGIAEFFELGFGPAAGALHVMFDRHWQWFEHTSHEVAVAMRDVQQAQDDLDASGVLPPARAQFQTRLDHVKIFVEWQRRYTEYFQAIREYDEAKLTTSGPGTIPTVSLAVRTAPSVIKIEIDGAGVNGTATFKWTKNADCSHVVWEATAVTVPTTPFTVSLGGRVATFANSTYTVGQAWSEAPNVAALDTATDRALEFAWDSYKTNVIHSTRVAEKIYGRTPQPYSLSSEGTTPPAMTVGSVAAYTPAAVGVGFVEIDCPLGGVRGTATIRYRVNGGAWSAAILTAATVSLPLARITITLANATFSTDNLWFITLSPNLGKYWIQDAAAGYSWAASAAPNTSELDTLVADGITDYTPIAGVTRRTFDPDSFVVRTASGVTTLRNGPQFSTPHAYVINKPAGTVTLKIVSNSTGTATLDVRVVLKTMAGATLQTWAAPHGTTDLVISAAAGLYRVYVIVVANAASLCRLQVPENVQCVLVNDDPQNVLPAMTRGFAGTTRWHFYVPSGETKIVMAYNCLHPAGVQFYDPAGVAVTTSHPDIKSWVCDVGAGQDDDVWSFTGFYSYDNISVVRFENCPDRLSPTAEQILIP